MKEKFSKASNYWTEGRGKIAPKEVPAHSTPLSLGFIAGWLVASQKACPPRTCECDLILETGSFTNIIMLRILTCDHPG